jgi:hypothetical protein
VPRSAWLRKSLRKKIEVGLGRFRLNPSFSDMPGLAFGSEYAFGELPPTLNLSRKNTMSQFAMITGDVTYTPGDGAPIEIPRVRVEVELAPDSATLSWEAAEGIAGVTAIPRIQFDDYVRDGKITMMTEQAG